jgi:hypothetical protein
MECRNNRDYFTTPCPPACPCPALAPSFGGLERAHRQGRGTLARRAQRRDRTRINTDSLKKLWRAMKCLVQVWLVHPFLAPHTLPTLSRWQLRSAQPLSEYTDRNVSKRYAGSGSGRLMTAHGVYLLAQTRLRSSMSATARGGA